MEDNSIGPGTSGSRKMLIGKRFIEEGGCGVVSYWLEGWGRVLTSGVLSGEGRGRAIQEVKQAGARRNQDRRGRSG